MSRLPENNFPDPAAPDPVPTLGGELGAEGQGLNAPIPAHPVGFGGQVGAGGFTPTGLPPKSGALSKVGKGTMLLFATLVLGIVTVAVVSQQSGPRTAEADQKIVSAMDNAIRNYKANPSATRKRNKDIFKDTNAIEKAFYGFAERTQVPADELKQNPFVHKAPRNPDQDKQAQERSWREEQRKKEEAQKKLAEQRRRIEAALKRLTIQTILYSDDDPMVLIDNRVYHTGGQLGIFVISKIHRDSIVLKVGDQSFVKNLD